MTTLRSLFLTAALAFAGCAGTTTQGVTPMSTKSATTTKATKTGYVQANGLSYYYEIHGAEGEPLLLLHGGLGSIDMFAPILPGLAAGRQVIAIDLQGHGRTALGDRPIDYSAIGDDMAEVLTKLGYTQVDALGYSFGGGVAFRLAVQHPKLVRRLALVSAGFAQDGFYAEMLPQQAAVGAGLADMMKNTPMYTSYAAVAPHPEEFPKLLDRMGELMRKPYNYAEDVKQLAPQTLLVFGDSDMYRPEHIVEYFQLLGGGKRDAGWQREHQGRHRLAILPNTTHYDMFMSPLLVPTVRPFLDGTQAGASWAEQVEKRP